MLSDLAGKGWEMVDPPEPTDEASVVGRYKGEPIKAGFMLDVVNDTDTTFHAEYRSGRYDLEVKIDFEIGRGQIRVKEAEGYE